MDRVEVDVESGDVRVVPLSEAEIAEIASRAAPDPVPEIISDRQFYQGLALKGKITNQEALDAVKTGAIPSIFQTALSGMTGNDAFGAEMLLSGAIEFRRSYPLTLQLGQALGFARADLDDFWRFAFAL